MLRDWLSFLRVHTSCLTQAGVVIGLLLAGVTELPMIIMFMVWAFLFHAWGFSDNNLEDYEYDLKDPAKKHFGLIKGTITVKEGKIVNLGFFVWTAILGLVLSRFQLVPIFLLGSAISLGLLYNRTCKTSLWAPLWIMLSFTSIPLFAYTTYSLALTPAIIFVIAYTMVLMFFQIALEGYLKDLGSDPVNLLAKMGVTRGVFIHMPSKVFAFWHLLKIGHLLSAVFFITTGFLITGGCVVLTAAITITASALMVFGVIATGNILNEQDNKKITTYAARIEIITYFQLVIALTFNIGIVSVGALILYPLIWFVILNRLTWGTWMRPAV